LKRLSDQAGRVAAGDLQVHVPVRGSSEVSYLSQVFNHMVASLQRGQREISQANEALIEKNRELHRLSITDGLTGLFNRKQLMDLFDMELARSQRYQVPFSVLIADIDHFKQINDTFGHLAGDAVLRRIADTLRQAVRECDHVGRYGGEEFLIILPNSSAPGAVEMAQRLREAISRVRFYNDGNEISMTISVGVAQCFAGEEGTEAILRRADAALYQAKANGRNCVIGP
jgi:diguanylate cyclase (GGDEF)-like protein